jgi:hypothetical protein
MQHVGGDSLRRDWTVDGASPCGPQRRCSSPRKAHPLHKHVFARPLACARETSVVSVLVLQHTEQGMAVRTRQRLRIHDTVPTLGNLKQTDLTTKRSGVCRERKASYSITTLAVGKSRREHSSPNPTNASSEDFIAGGQAHLVPWLPTPRALCLLHHWQSAEGGGGGGGGGEAPQTPRDN